MIEFVFATLTAYIMACVIAASSIFEPIRNRIIAKTPKLKIGQNKHFLECRLCLSFWTALIAVLVYTQNPLHALPVYGMAYFLATQER
jgi:hypothetical protein